MDVRTVLSCLALAAPDPGELPGDVFRAALLRSLRADAGTRHTLEDLGQWLTRSKVDHPLDTRRVPLAGISGWHRDADAVAHDEGRYFRIVGVSVRATQREVRSWTQPLLAPVGQGVIAFLVTRVDGVLHALVQARVEAGLLDGVELAPTVQCTPANLAGTGLPRPPFLDTVLGADPADIRYDTLLSDEGGRSYHSLARHLVVEVPETFAAREPDGFRWVSVGQLVTLTRHSYQVNVQARSLLTVLHSLWTAEASA
ncbi:NDP-hexose 2,3-dehydratase family protein [Streptomyces sp. NPDC059897]|uniref:NDP-hexose 2,3-dehydratase family protein n=1 Tax=Streptomyces sp. NPDC059897 TaxID=3346994 RepID=UPI0036598D73